MPTLQEIYDRAVERHGEDSFFAKMMKEQRDADEKASSAERHFIAGGRPMDTSKD
tara:strand:+ start:5463 stop:5627 length:165 start_codon:yes stop_codon:yes gene_type:complete